MKMTLLEWIVFYITIAIFLGGSYWWWFIFGKPKPIVVFPEQEDSVSKIKDENNRRD